MVVDEVNLMKVKEEIGEFERLYYLEVSFMDTLGWIENEESRKKVIKAHSDLAEWARDRYVYRVFKALVHNPRTPPEELFRLLEVNKDLLTHGFLCTVGDVFPADGDIKRWLKTKVASFAYRNSIRLDAMEVAFNRKPGVEYKDSYIIYKARVEESPIDI